MMTQEQKKAVSLVKAELGRHEDLKDKAFMRRLIPNIPPERIIGVRTPDIRAFCKSFSKDPLAQAYLQVLPHDSYEENAVHGFLIGSLFKGDLDRTYAEIERYLPYVDNWANCDGLPPKNLRDDIGRLHRKVVEWSASARPFTQRFGIVCALDFLLEDSTFQADLLRCFAGIVSEEYYVNIAIAWYYSVALVKQYDATVGLIESGDLGTWVHNKSIQKAIESYRISDERKTYLRSLRKR